MAFSRQPLAALVIDAGAPETDKGEHSAQEDIDLPEIRKFLQHPRRNKPVIGVIIHYFRSHTLQQPVKALRRESLEEGVLFARASHAVDYLGSLKVFVHHFVHRRDVVLTVAVDGYGNIAQIPRFHKTGKQCALVSPVAALGNALEIFAFPGKSADDIPCGVGAAVVDKQYSAIGTDFVFRDEFFQFFEEELACDGQNLFLVIAWDNHI